MANDNKEQFATNVYYDRTFDCDAAKILPGEYYYTPKDMLIVTVLGSCVSACIRDRVTGLGGMNHFMLPDGGSDANSPVSASMRYGSSPARGATTWKRRCSAAAPCCAVSRPSTWASAMPISS
jgi:chemotaxis protein CheD